MMAGGEQTKLDDATIRVLESSLPKEAKQLYDHLKSKCTVSLHDARKDTLKEQVKAYTRDCGDHYEIWLTPDHEDLFDSFIHELGQVNTFVLGYKSLNPKRSNDPKQWALNNQLAAFARNAFIFYVCESKLAKYGIDRSPMKEKSKKHFLEVLNNRVPPIKSPRHAIVKESFSRALLCYEYVPTRLFLDSDFEPLERLWQEKIQYSNIRYQIRTVYLEALKEEITPERYNYLQRFFAQTLDLDFFE